MSFIVLKHVNVVRLQYTALEYKRLNWMSRFLENKEIVFKDSVECMRQACVWLNYIHRWQNRTSRLNDEKVLQIIYHWKQLKLMDVKFEWDRKKVFKLWDSVSSAVQGILTDVALLIQNSAKQNAPVWNRDNYPPTPSNKKRRWWTLKKSISTNFDFLQRWTVVVWSPVKYARVREYVNNLNPHTKKYLRRWYSENKIEIKNIIYNDLSKALK